MTHYPTGKPAGIRETQNEQDNREAVTDSRNVASVLKEAMVALDAGQTILHQTGDINGANIEFNCAFGCLETLKDLLKA